MSRHEDPGAAALIAFLDAEGAAEMPHARGRTLLDHLVGTYTILRRWGQPVWVQHAALVHSAYGTESYERQLLSVARRAELGALAGDRAERLAYLFGVTPRRPLFAGTHLWARDMPLRRANGGDPPTRDELDALVLLHMANIAEQACAGDGSPGRWLVRVRELAELLLDSDTVTPPLFIARLDGFESREESLTRAAYLEGVREPAEAGAGRLALAAAVCPVVPEPCVWLAQVSRRRGDVASSRSWTAQARKRLSALGTAWDKRLTFEEWLAVIDELESSPGEDPGGTVTDPRALFEARVGHKGEPRSTAGAAAIVPPDPESGRKRFHRYVERFGDDGGVRPGAIYPDLPSRPWHDPRDVPLVGHLESNFDAIRDEILALHEARFHRESERIGRTGDWDVAFLYERGRRRDEVCAACPVTAHAVETYPAIRSLAGLTYVSRMRPMTHIDAHRGPTNLRVRCHLAIKVPEGDCAIRVGVQARRWEEGRCLVFDDHFEHEAWNHTDEDRIVLIVDLWHPGLSEVEVTLLESLQSYTHVQAERLARYWSANARAAREARPGEPA